jgi:ATP-dependent Lon protease
MLMTIRNLSNDVMLTNFVCTNLPFSVKDKISMLNKDNLKDRIIELLRNENRELQLQQLKNQIHEKTREDLDEQQREYFLQQQMKNIKAELGGGEKSPEKQELEEKAKTKKWPEEIANIFYKELDKLDMFNPQGPEYSVQLNYLQQMVALPWREYTQDNLDLQRAQKILDRDHYGMEKVKERILEYLAVLQLRGDLKSPIICLYGPPGVGKTSLGKSVADGMKRKYVRMSLGGLHDESEIRGHRRTYVGAMPGRIIKNIQKAGSSNPVFILDEIDKVTQNTINGDPSSALLEVLDPEQNSAFHDNFLDVDYDLSKVLFIATANDLNTIPVLCSTAWKSSKCRGISLRRRSRLPSAIWCHASWPILVLTTIHRRSNSARRHSKKSSSRTPARVACVSWRNKSTRLCARWRSAKPRW